ncbi:Trm112 family protein [Rhodanobacter sp. DHB23]|uniref:Trm112 family protein n=1 Tax=Rhodanobacter sp. DHB23 TaxID=2775923 RepID=UPI00178497AC|nr:Trm112 family protein [Rhodanobacter sp. DHB23]MBD8873090.1 hypothetical protein [Rhodanobacter sp. DHB23]
MDKHLLDILCCPVSKTPLRLLGRTELDALNGAIATGAVLTTAGHAVDERLAEGLITIDRKLVYRVADGIPVMLPEEGIATLQLHDFPTAA